MLIEDFNFLQEVDKVKNRLIVAGFTDEQAQAMAEYAVSNDII